MDKLSKTIYRIDDRLIHGQVIEGWINYFRIPNVVLVNDAVASDDFKKLIYQSIIPPRSSLFVFGLGDFNLFDVSVFKGDTLVIVASVEDLWSIMSKITPEDYINIGCLACGVRHIEISDTVFIDNDECRVLREIVFRHEVFVHKLPWEPPLNLKDVIDNVCGEP